MMTATEAATGDCNDETKQIETPPATIDSVTVVLESKTKATTPKLSSSTIGPINPSPPLPVPYMPSVPGTTINPPPMMFCGTCGPAAAEDEDNTSTNNNVTAIPAVGIPNASMLMTLPIISPKKRTTKKKKKKKPQMVFISDFVEKDDDGNFFNNDNDNDIIDGNNDIETGANKLVEKDQKGQMGITQQSQSIHNTRSSSSTIVVPNDYSTIVSTNVSFETINSKQRTLIQHVLEGMEHLHSFQILARDDSDDEDTYTTTNNKNNNNLGNNMVMSLMNLSTSDETKEDKYCSNQEVNIQYNPNVVSIDKILESFSDLGVRNKILNSTTNTARMNNNRNGPGNQNNHHSQTQQFNPATTSSATNNNSKVSSSSSSSSSNLKCRSSFYVDGICCASEVPIVTSIIKSLPKKRKYIHKVSINITNRMVYVEYHPDHVTATEILNELVQEGFQKSRIESDGNLLLEKRRKKKMKEEALKLQQQQQQQENNDDDHGENSASFQDVSIQPSPLHYDLSTESENNNTKQSKNITSNFVESVLYAPSIIDEDAIEIIQDTFYENGFLHDSIRSYTLNVASKTMKIEHNPKLVSIQNVVDTLMEDERTMTLFDKCRILVDGLQEGLILPNDDHNDSTMSIVTTGGTNNSLFRRMKQRGLRYLRCCGFGLGHGLSMSIILSGLFWIVSIVGHFTNNQILMYMGLLSVLFGIPPVARKAYHTLRRKQFDANCMMVTAAIGAVALQQYDEAASVAFLFAISEFLEDRATRKAKKAMDDIINLRPDHANYIDEKTGEIKIVPVSDLDIDDLVSVRMGDKIPSDGVVVEGFSQIDESSLTGESIPLNKGVGDKVSGGTINVGSTRLVVRTTALVEDSAVSRLIRLVEESASSRSQTEQLVDAFARSYTPTVICVALVFCTVPWFWGIEVGRQWTLNGLIIVVIACPCALTISTPVTYAAGLAATAQKGIIVKGGAKLEALGSVKKIIFDKTGTLTEGKFRLIDLQLVGRKRNRREVLELLAIMEGPSSHPLAATLVKAAKDEGVKPSSDVSIVDHSILKGEGVTAIVNDEETYVGNVRLFKRLGMYCGLSDSEQQTASNWNDDGSTVGFIGTKNLGIIGMFCVADAVRYEAKEVINALTRDSVEIHMLTGDGAGPARAVAKEVGIPQQQVKSQFLPEDKLHYIASLLRSSKQGSFFNKTDLLLMCGDGVNDAPALAVADVGVAMGEGAALALEISDVTLMDSNLTKLLFSIKTGMRVIVTVQENILTSVAAKILVIILTFMGKMTLLGAIASDVGVMLLVSINGMKLLPGGPGLCCKKKTKYGKIDLLEPNGNIV